MNRTRIPALQLRKSPLAGAYGQALPVDDGRPAIALAWQHIFAAIDRSAAANRTRGNWAVSRLATIEAARALAHPSAYCLDHLCRLHARLASARSVRADSAFRCLARGRAYLLPLVRAALLVASGSTVAEPPAMAPLDHDSLSTAR